MVNKKNRNKRRAYRVGQKRLKKLREKIIKTSDLSLWTELAIGMSGIGDIFMGERRYDRTKELRIHELKTAVSRVFLDGEERPEICRAYEDVINGKYDTECSDRSNSDCRPPMLQDVSRGGTQPNVITPPVPIFRYTIAEIDEMADKDVDPAHELLERKILEQEMKRFYARPEPLQMLILNALSFWEVLYLGFATYRIGVREQILDDKGEGWSCFDAKNLQRLLPGITVPVKKRRLLYWGRLTTVQKGQVLYLDLFGENGCALCRIKFRVREPNLNPLPLPRGVRNHYWV